MKLHVRHTTDYRYTEPLRYALQTMWLTPPSGPAQTVNFWSLGAPEKLLPARRLWQQGQLLHLRRRSADNVRWSLVNAAGEVETFGIAEFTDADSLPHPSFPARHRPGRAAPASGRVRPALCHRAPVPEGRIYSDFGPERRRGGRSQLSKK